MGSAFVRAALASGHRVAVWNRSAVRARALVVDGAQVMESAEDAVRSAPIAILCVGTPADAREVLESVGPAAFAGVTVLNVTSGGPEDSVAIGRWADARGVSYLDGAILAYPKQIGTQEACILVAGSDELWQAHASLVHDLAGSSLHVGPDYGAASVIDASFTGGFFISSVVAFIEAIRHMTAFGASTSVIESLLGYASSQLEGEMRDVLQRVESGEFTTDQASLKVYQEASQGWLASMPTRDAAPMLTAAVATLCRGVDEGLGEKDIAALVKLRTP
jgi:3-hydroxyisobutyrate dehydrogenase-like beta-hydroxyacid dehydrogenase